MQGTVTRKLYAAPATGTTNDAAHFDVSADMWLLGINAAVMMTTTTAGDNMCFEISTASQNQVLMNDALNVLAYFHAGLSLITSGANQPTVNATCSPLKCYIPRGTRVYLHTVGNKTTGSCFGNFVFHFAYA